MRMSNKRSEFLVDSPLCACGCGQPVSRIGLKWNKYVHNHHWKGKTRKPFSDEHRAKISVNTKKQFIDNHPTRGKKCVAGSRAKLGKKNPRFGKCGAATPNWKGGETYARGYKLLRVPTHPKARNGYVYEHVLATEKFLGRYLRTGEVVHHINGDKQDNREDNLFVTSRSGHRSAHTSMHAVVYELVKRGVVRFNSNEGRYELK